MYANLSLWFAYPGEDVSPVAEQRCIEVMSESERARIEAMRPGKVRQQYVVAHTLVRRALSAEMSVAPAVWQFRTAPHGKPEIDPDCGLRFNLSHSLELTACLVSKGWDLGVDTEHVRRAAEIMEIAEEVFSPFELEQIATLPNEEKDDRALSLWVLKEAYVKARGMGLSMPLKTFSIMFGGEQGIRLQCDGGEEQESKRWRFCLLEHREHRIALFVRTHEHINLELWELRPVLGDPRRLAAREPVWFAHGKPSL